MQRRRLLMVLALLGLVFLASCTGSPFTRNGEPDVQNYYQGTRGVITRFSDPNSPPGRVFYYEDADPRDNTFPIVLEVWNDGASYAKGGIYIGGYDPWTYQIPEMNIPRTGSGLWEDCYVVLNTFENFDDISGSVQCSTAGVGINYQNGNQWQANIRNIGETFGIDTGILQDVGVQVGRNGNAWDWNINLGNLQLLGTHFNNGKAVAFMLDLLNFERYNGWGYALEGDTPDYPGGELEIKDFEVTIQNWPPSVDQQTTTFFVTNCYAYTTYANPQVCIDPDPNNNRRKVCNDGMIQFGGSNGAPVAITNVDVTNTGRKTLFDITIQNVGPGDVYDLFYIERCNPYSQIKMNAKQLNVVYLFDARIGGQPLICNRDRGDGIRLVNGQGSITCEYNIEFGTAGNAYTTPLILELGYGYAEQLQRQVNVRRI